MIYTNTVHSTLKIFQTKTKIFQKYFSSVVTDLLMSEAVRYYTRNRKEHSEDSGVESGNSLENNGELKSLFQIVIK